MGAKSHADKNKPETTASTISDSDRDRDRDRDIDIAIEVDYEDNVGVNEINDRNTCNVSKESIAPMVPLVTKEILSKSQSQSKLQVQLPIQLQSVLPMPPTTTNVQFGSSLAMKSLHRSKHLLDHDLEPLQPTHSSSNITSTSSSTRTPTTSNSSSPSTSSTSLSSSSSSSTSILAAASVITIQDHTRNTDKVPIELEKQRKACDLAKKVYEKTVKESQSRLLDMTDNFPHFHEAEIIHGEVLGKGCFGTVYEVRGFDLTIEEQGHAIQQRSRSFRLTRDHVPDEEVPPGDMESRRFMATHAFRKEGHARYAIKKLSHEIIEKSTDLVQGLADLVLEAKILSAIEHPHIIKLRAIKAGDRFRPDFFIVMDRLYETLAQRIEVWRHEQEQLNGGGSNMKKIFNRIITFRRTRIAKASSYQDRVVQAYHLSSALNYLHKQNLIHRDLKPENIGFDVRGDIKIFDFGMAKEMPPRRTSTSATTYKFTGMCGSPRYMAPEVAHKQCYNEKCDVYSFAVLFSEILSLKSAFGHYNDFESMFAQVWGPPYMRPNMSKLIKQYQIPENIHQLISNGWHYDFTKRPSMHVIENTLYEECKTFPNITIQCLSHRRRKSKVIYDKEKQVFRVNSMLFDGKLKEYQVATQDSFVKNY